MANKGNEKKNCISAITADVSNDPVWHGDADYGGNIREKKEYHRDDS